MNAHIGLEGEYRLVVTRNGEEVQDTGWFKNLILDQGLDRLGDQTLFGGGGGTFTYFGGYIQVGTGSTPPTVSDTGLVSRIGGLISSSPQSGISGATMSGGVVSEGSPTYGRTMTWSFPFGQGALVGNLAELGFGWSATGNTLFSRALITNQSGQPTTITTTSIDQVTVYYKLRFLPQFVATSGTTTIAGVTTDWVVNGYDVASGFMAPTYFYLGQTNPGSTYGTSWTYPKGSPRFYSSPVMFLYNFDGGSLASTGANTATLNLNSGAVISTTTTKFGTGALDLTATSSSASHQNVYDLGSVFTVEGWINLPTVGTTVRTIYSNPNSSSVVASLFLTVSTDGRFQACVNPTGGHNVTGSTIIESAAGAIVASTWHHVAVSKDVNGLRIYVDGVKVGEDVSMGSLKFSGNGYIPRFGYPVGAGSSSLGGFIDAFRITKLALYTNNFTTPTAAPTPLLTEHSVSAMQLLGEPVSTEPSLVFFGTGAPTAYSVGFPATVGTYTPGTYYREYQFELGISVANSTTGLWGVVFYLLGDMPFQLVFNKPIMKDNTKKLKFVVRFSWGRV